MPPSVRLYRRATCERLERIQLKWNKLPYCNFVIQAELEMNPDWSENPELNFSNIESIRGYSGRDLILEDNRVDRNLVYYFGQRRNEWNNDPRNHYRQLYVVPHEGVQMLKPTRKKPDKSRSVIYWFMETLRGRGAVGSVNQRFDDGIAGLQTAQDRIRDSMRVSRVDVAVDEILEENRRIQGR